MTDLVPIVSGAGALPEAVRAAGLEAVRQLGELIFAAFEATDEIGVPLGPESLRPVFARLHLEEFESRLDWTDLPDLAALWARVRASIEQNPVLLTFGARWLALSDEERAEAFPPAADRAAPIRHAVHYCAALHVLTRAMVEDESFEPDGAKPLAVDVIARLAAVREQIDWRPFASVFERLKITSLDQALGVDAQFKWNLEAFTEIREFGGVFLQINVLEAMFQDVLQRCEPNAAAGFELFANGTGRDPITGLGNQRNQPLAFGAATRLPDRRPPYPTAWAWLYESWNLAFCSTYSNNIDFYAKLLTPCVTETCVQAPGVYMHYRGFALYLHAHYELFARVERGQRAPDFDWRSSVLTTLWGEVNAEMARSYAEQIAVTLGERSGAGTRWWQRIRRGIHQVFWGGVVLVTRVARVFVGP